MFDEYDKSIKYITETIAEGKTAGGGKFFTKCSNWLEQHLQAQKVLLTNSCTAALEMAVFLCNLKAGDEVIMPSFNFPSAANATLNSGGTPVFVDIRPDTLNIDETKIEAAITAKTRTVIVMHYAGVPCEMDAIMAVAKKYKLLVIEDAAQALLSAYKGKKLGTIGDFGCFSFHATKNFSMGEGGALVVKNKQYNRRAEQLLYKGTNRMDFEQGNVNTYTWVERSASFLPSEINVAYLLAQLEKSEVISAIRMNLWNKYYQAFKDGLNGKIICPTIPKNCAHNAHIFWLMFENKEQRDAYIAYMRNQNIVTAFHFQPLHSSPMGETYCRFVGKDEYTTYVSQCLVRLPLYPAMTENEQNKVIEETKKFVRKI